MAAGILILPDLSLVLGRAWGTTTSADLLRAAHRTREDATFRPHMRQLVDFRDITDLLIDAATVQQLAVLQPFAPDARRALLVASDFVYGMSRMYQMLRESPQDQLDVFRDLDEALEWLELAAEKDRILETLTQIAPLT